MLEAHLDGIRVREIDSSSEEDLNAAIRMSDDPLIREFYFRDQYTGLEYYWKKLFKNYQRLREGLSLLGSEKKLYCFFAEDQQSRRRGFFNLCFDDSEENFLVASVAYFVERDSRRQRIGLKALHATCSLAFQMPEVRLISAECLRENQTSRNLLVRAGFEYCFDSASISEQVFSVYFLSKRKFTPLA
jgi:RimJ/RimL family protein N-acetyltransferase